MRAAEWYAEKGNRTASRQSRGVGFALERRSGRILRISFSLSDLPDFARLSLSSIPESRIEPQARDVLERMAAGELPKA
jgi:hypothetical protein